MTEGTTLRTGKFEGPRNLDGAARWTRLGSLIMRRPTHTRRSTHPTWNPGFVFLCSYLPLLLPNNAPLALSH